MFFFAQPWWLLLLPAGWIFLRSFHRSQYLPISSADLVPAPGRLALIAKSPPWLFRAMLISAVVALSGPRVYQAQSTETIMGRDIVVAIDISGSMSAPLPKPPGHRPQIPGYYDIPSPTGQNQPYRRIDAAQDAFAQFVSFREQIQSGDRIGLYLFDDSPRLAWPLTHDLRQLYRKASWLPLNFLNERVMGAGTNFGDKGYGPLDAAVDHFNDYGQSPARVFILITDGEDKLSDSTKSRLASMLQKNNVRFYVIGVGETLAREDVDILAVARSMDGHVFRVEKAGDMDKCFETINQLEQGPITVSSFNVFQELYPHALVLALIFGIFWMSAVALVVVI